MGKQRRTVAEVEKEYQGRIAELEKKLASAGKGGLCPACAEKKAKEDAIAAAKAAEEKRLGELAVAKKKRLELLALREKNRAGRDPHCLDEKSQKAEDKFNAQIRELNRVIQGVDPLA